MTRYRVIFGLLILGFVAVVALTVTPPAVPTQTTSRSMEDTLGETMTLSLFRNPGTRDAVMRFFTELTGRSEVAQAILTACDENNVSPILAFSLAKKESSFRPYVVGRNLGSQDRGLFQLNTLSYPNLPLSAALNPWINAHLGVRHIRESIRLAGSIEKGLATYNAGFSRVQRNLTPASTHRYVRTILGFMDTMERQFIQHILLDSRIASEFKIPKRPDVLASHAQ